MLEGEASLSEQSHKPASLCSLHVKSLFVSRYFSPRNVHTLDDDQTRAYLSGTIATHAHNRERKLGKLNY